MVVLFFHVYILFFHVLNYSTPHAVSATDHEKKRRNLLMQVLASPCHGASAEEHLARQCHIRYISLSGSASGTTNITM
jgi:hypothetical protein